MGLFGTWQVAASLKISQRPQYRFMLIQVFEIILGVFSAGPENYQDYHLLFYLFFFSSGPFYACAHVPQPDHLQRFATH